LLIPNPPANNIGKYTCIFKNSYTLVASISTSAIEGLGGIREGACADVQMENGKWMKHS